MVVVVVIAMVVAVGAIDWRLIVPSLCFRYRRALAEREREPKSRVSRYGLVRLALLRRYGIVRLNGGWMDGWV